MTTPTSVIDNQPSQNQPGQPGGRRRRWWLAGIAAVLAIAATAGAGYAVGVRHRPSGAEQTMAARAAQVMPFDLDATTHTFTNDATGGVEQILAKDPGDQRNIRLIRQHLRKEAGQFARGDYRDPATIHGSAMPGLQELRAGAERVRVRYEQVPSGARITYSSSDPVLVAALHAWFDAQNSDHAMPGMGVGQ
jgi:hypothetical protein